MPIWVHWKIQRENYPQVVLRVALNLGGNMPNFEGNFSISKLYCFSTLLLDFSGRRDIRNFQYETVSPFSQSFSLRQMEYFIVFLTVFAGIYVAFFPYFEF